MKILVIIILILNIKTITENNKIKCKFIKEFKIKEEIENKNLIKKDDKEDKKDDKNND